MADPLPGGDHATLAFLQNASTYIDANAITLGVPTARSTLLLSQAASFDTNLSAHDTAQAASRGACAAKDATRDAVDQTAREIFGTIRSNTNVTRCGSELLRRKRSEKSEASSGKQQIPGTKAQANSKIQ